MLRYFLLLPLFLLSACHPPMLKSPPEEPPIKPNTSRLPNTLPPMLEPPLPSLKSIKPITPRPNISYQPSSQPFLRLNPNMHTAMITRIDTDAAGRFAVSASDDKTLRVWDVREQRLLSVLRPLMGKGNEGKLYAVAMSPDGNWIATGGWTGNECNTIQLNCSIYLFHRPSGTLRQRLSGLPNVINHLAFSADGQRLAAALAGDHGIRLYAWDTALHNAVAHFREIARDSDYADRSLWVEFSADGRLLSTALDGFLRLYDVKGHLQHKTALAAGKEPFAARFNPAGDQIAVGFYDSAQVMVVDGQDLHELFAADTQGIDNGDLSKIAWSADGQVLWAGGQYQQQGIRPLIRWSQGGRGTHRVLPAAQMTLMDLRALPDGGLLFGAADPLLGWLDAQEQIKVLSAMPLADFRANDDGFLVSQDAGHIQFGYQQWGKQPAHFSLADLQLQTGASTEASLQAPHTQGLDITGWEDTYTPQLKGQPLALKPYERSRSLAIAPQQASFLLGTEWYLRHYSAAGELLWRQAVPGIVWGVNISGDGSKAVAAFGDGTIRWFRLSDGEELLAFYPHPDQQRWVLWTPEGFFAHSPGADSLIGYHLNRGADQAGEFIGVEQVYDLFYRPDLVQAKFNGEEDVIRQAVTDIGDIRQVLRSGLPPQLTLIDGERLHLKSREHVLQVQVNDQGGGIGRFEVRVNGKPLPASQVRAGVPQGAKGQTLLRLPFTLDQKINSIEVLAYNADNQVASRSVTQSISVDDPMLSAPDLYVLAVGINAYDDGALTLKYAAPDAQAVLQHLSDTEKTLFKNVHAQLLTNAQAQRSEIERALDAIAAQAQAQDVFVLYLSGHGLVDQGRYYFVPKEALYSNRTALLQQSLTHDFLTTKMNNVLARKTVMLLDTCYAGAAVTTRGMENKTAVDHLIRATGSAVIAASSDQQMALEGHKGHGLFTYAVLKGLRGAADSGRDKDVKITELASYVSNLVPKISFERFQYRQVPMYELKGQAFPLVRFR